MLCQIKIPSINIDCFKRIIRPCRILYFTGKESNIDLVLNVKMNIGVKFILSLSLSLSLSLVKVVYIKEKARFPNY